jgi:hypothetical protein
MGSFADYLENKLLDHVHNQTTFTSPTNLYFALSTTTINDDGTGMTEPVGGAYARVNMAANTTNFPAASGGAISNAVAITFPTATGSWGTVTYFAVMDASSGGNMLGYAALTASKTIDSGDTPSFAIGDYDCTLD